MKMKWCVSSFLMCIFCIGIQLRAQTIHALVSFNNTNGAYPVAPLIVGKDGNFYGTTFNGGPYNGGTVFKVTTNGTLATLVVFNGTNGWGLAAALALGNDGNFYSTTYEGNDKGNDEVGLGTVFMLTTNGTLTTLAHLDRKSTRLNSS